MIDRRALLSTVHDTALCQARWSDRKTGRAWRTVASSARVVAELVDVEMSEFMARSGSDLLLASTCAQLLDELTRDLRGADLEHLVASLVAGHLALASRALVSLGAPEGARV